MAMRSRKISLAALVLGILAIGAGVGAYLTRQPVIAPPPEAKQASGGALAGIDERLLEAVRTVVPLAESAEELGFAAQALRLANHEYDQAFTIAMREAALTPPPATGRLKELADRIAELKLRLAADKADVARLTPLAAANEDAMASLELAKAQLSLDQDDVAEAQGDLERRGGDRRANLARIQKEHEAGENASATTLKAAAPLPTSTLFQQATSWWELGARLERLDAARSQAANRMAQLVRQHGALQKASGPAPVTTFPAGVAAGGAANQDEEEDIANTIARLRRLADQKKTLTQIGTRIQDILALVGVYGRWMEIVQARRRGVLHLILISAAIILSIALAAMAIIAVVRRLLLGTADRRQAHQMRTMANIAVQITAAVAILLVVFGPPTQLSTIIGLTTAGLTVALKDFVVAIFGWFALMGKNGIRIGDWVEIEGVGGEVVEIGLLKTVLLEMGTWTSTGHPTGRRVAFVNKFAIENHYFNFSTAGQWLWDELQLTLPSIADAYPLAERIRETVERETEDDARLAEKEWARATHQYETMRPFSAKPSVDLRPSGSGLEASVRYITRAPQRYEVKSRLLQAVVPLVHGPAATA
jgi:small-conductance mechanosensitive channel